MNTDLDWRAIERAYVCGEPMPGGTPLERRFPSLRELAASHGVGHWKIGRRSRRDDWLGARRQFRAFLRREICRIEARRAVEAPEHRDK